MIDGTEEEGYSFILDRRGLYIAHPDTDMVARREDLRNARGVMMLIEDRTKEIVSERWEDDLLVVRTVPGLDWIVGCRQPRSEAFASVRLYRFVVVVSGMATPALAFVDNYARRFGAEPDFYAMLAYNAMTVVETVVETGVENRRRNEDLKDAMVRIGRVDGLQGQIFIDAFGDCELERHLLVVKNEAFTVMD